MVWFSICVLRAYLVLVVSDFWWGFCCVRWVRLWYLCECGLVVIFGCCLRVCVLIVLGGLVLRRLLAKVFCGLVFDCHWCFWGTWLVLLGPRHRSYLRRRCFGTGCLGLCLIPWFVVMVDWRPVGCLCCAAWKRICTFEVGCFVVGDCWVSWLYVEVCHKWP